MIKVEITGPVLLGAIKEIELMFKVKSSHESLGGEQVQSDECPGRVLSWAETYSLVQFSHSVVSNSLWPHEPKHARPPCPTPGVYPNSCPLSWWCHPTISYSVIPFSSCLQSFPASGSFPMSQFFSLGGQSIGASASASVPPMNIQDWFPLGWTGLIRWLHLGWYTYD